MVITMPCLLRNSGEVFKYFGAELGPDVNCLILDAIGYVVQYKIWRDMIYFFPPLIKEHVLWVIIPYKKPFHDTDIVGFVECR